MTGVVSHHSLISRLCNFGLPDPKSPRDGHVVGGILVCLVAFAVSSRAAHSEFPRRDPDVRQAVLLIHARFHLVGPAALTLLVRPWVPNHQNHDACPDQRRRDDSEPHPTTAFHCRRTADAPEAPAAQALAAGWIQKP